MTGHRLPSPKDPAHIESLSDFLNCIIDRPVATYVSVPITTGKRFMLWFATEGRKLLGPEGDSTPEYRREHRIHVIEKNTRDAHSVVSRLRAEQPGIIVDPTRLDRPEWDQHDFRYFWGKVVERYACTIVLLDGWQYSSGCSWEFLTGLRQNLHVLDESRRRVTLDEGKELIDEAIKEMEALDMDAVFLREISRELTGEGERLAGSPGPAHTPDPASVLPLTSPLGSFLYKDAVLDKLAIEGNVAQFVSFGPGPEPQQRKLHIRGLEPNQQLKSPLEAISQLLLASPERTVNVRTFRPDERKGWDLLYGLDEAEKVLIEVKMRAANDQYAIVNETIDIKDGGVSGVAMGDLMEFSPDDTPKCVDKPGTCSLPRDVGLQMLEIVYGFRPGINFDQSIRVEFSIHPRRRGLRNETTIVWELEEQDQGAIQTSIRWPNNFSRMIGDKTFGLLVAHVLGLRVPKTTVIGRRVAPFVFGRETRTLELWTRTCPEERIAGKYATFQGWRDPFALLAEEEERAASNNDLPRIASVLAQQAVNPEYSGSVIPGTNGPIIEGVRGCGDRFMLGKQTPEQLPDDVRKNVANLFELARKRLGPVEIEWVYDGTEVWVVQLLGGVATSGNGVIVPGKRERMHRFVTADGLDALRELIRRVDGDSEGIVLIGDVGITSHFGDLLRQAKIPSWIERPNPSPSH